MLAVLPEKNHKGPIYLDNQATTPTDERVVEAMLPFFSQKFGNPHSGGHAFGWEAHDAVEDARAKIANLIGAEPREIIFTSGATESNNLAIKGAARFNNRKSGHIITSSVEHKCVLEACNRLEEDGFKVTCLGVDASGFISLSELEAAITDETILVSLMGVNNETGVIQPLAEIGAICRKAGVYFHSDCAQAAGKIPLDVGEMKIDLMSISGHKLYGPMGIGVLYVRRRPRARLQPLFDGGGQERGFRSGTLPAPLCVGMGVACEISGLEMADESARLKLLRGQFLEQIQKVCPEVRVNGDLTSRVPGNLNLCFPGMRAEDLLTGLRGVAISTGSACTSASVEPSYVLRAMGLSDEDAGASVRIGFGRLTTEDEALRAARIIADGVRHQLDGTYAQDHIKPAAQVSASAAWK